jgi:SNF2 family DNA or RNA helicase
VYKPGNKIANAIKLAIEPFPKVLLTATPLQNSLLELFGLVSIIDEYTFGDLKSFKTQFARLTDESDFVDLKERLRTVCKRTLRKQVYEYINYTDRHALVQEFIPSKEEQKLYDMVTEYLQRPTLYALPAGQRQLMTLILRKLLASSTYAISDTFLGLAMKLEARAKEAEFKDDITQPLSDDFDQLDEMVDEWEDEAEEEGAVEKLKEPLNPGQLVELKEELALLKSFYELGKSIERNSKGDVLLTALRRG